MPGQHIEQRFFWMLKDQLWHIMEAYIDDMVVKSIHESAHIAHLTKMFAVLKEAWTEAQHRVAEKCAFGVGSG